MKKLFHKNQMMVAALAFMIAAAGYLNYSGKLFPGSKTTAEKGTEMASQELLDISDGDVEATDAEVEGTPGEAVLTGAQVQSTVAQAKVSREQVRAKNKETLQEIIDSKQVSDQQRQEAVNQMLEMTKLAERENAAETLLASKGFADAVVTISEGAVDVVVGRDQLSDAQRAQIEDVVTRKAEVEPENIVITPIYAAEQSSETKEEASEEK